MKLSNTANASGIKTVRAKYRTATTISTINRVVFLPFDRFSLITALKISAGARTLNTVGKHLADFSLMQTLRTVH